MAAQVRFEAVDRHSVESAALADNEVFLCLLNH
jgi:hypothetical protein